MARMFYLGGESFVGGFIVFFILFWISAPRGGPDRLLFVVFALMAAVPVAAIGALFGAVKIVQEELRETRREIKAWRTSFEMVDEIGTPSTRFKSGPPQRG